MCHFSWPVDRYQEGLVEFVLQAMSDSLSPSILMRYHIALDVNAGLSQPGADWLAYLQTWKGAVAVPAGKCDAGFPWHKADEEKEQAKAISRNRGCNDWYQASDVTHVCKAPAKDVVTCPLEACIHERRDQRQEADAQIGATEFRRLKETRKIGGTIQERPIKYLT